jgi:hypothetical protein
MREETGIPAGSAVFRYVRQERLAKQATVEDRAVGLRAPGRDEVFVRVFKRTGTVLEVLATRARSAHPSFSLEICDDANESERSRTAEMGM